MKMWRVYQILKDGRQRCTSRSFYRERVQATAWITGLGVAGSDVIAVEMRSPDGRVWRYDMPAPSNATPEQKAAAIARLRALSPEELARRKKEASTRVASFFDGDEPRPSPSLERVKEIGRRKLREFFAQREAGKS